MGSVVTFPVLHWTDGSTVHSVVLSRADGVEHEYWVTRDGQVVAKCPSLTAVDDWHAAGH